MTSEIVGGNIRKMRVEYSPTQSGAENNPDFLSEGVVQYTLPYGEKGVSLNPLIGKKLELKFTGVINCTECGRKIKKSFSGGFCFPCFQTLPQADMCIVKPETCHFHLGTCRDASWGERNCMRDHTVYLSNASGLKVGITREKNSMVRWIDQGAVQGIALGTVASRLDSGKVEMSIKKQISDKTNWRKMLKGEIELLDLEKIREEVLPLVNSEVRFSASSSKTVEIRYPVIEYPSKVSSFNLDKNPIVSGVLMGIKGQYLIFDTGVINMRKYAGYFLELSY